MIEHEFVDDTNTFYSFNENPTIVVSDSEAPLSPVEESKIKRPRTPSILKTPFGSGETSPNSNDREKYSLYTLVQQKDAHSYTKLKKKLSKKRFIEHLNDQNERGKTSLHLTIERENFPAVELLLQSYKAHLGKLDINIQDSNGNTPLHIAAET
jgi:hypothetical protein